MKTKSSWIVIFLLPGVILFAFIFALSIGTLFITSFTNWTIGSSAEFIGVKNYIELIKSEDYFKAMLNTIVWIVLQSTIHVAIGVSFALIVMKNRWYHKAAKTIFMLPNIISSAALGMMFLNVFNPMFGPVNSFVRALGFENFNKNWFMDPRSAFQTVTMTWLAFAAIVAILMLAEISSISSEIFDAASIDGANQFAINTKIILPMSRNVIGTCTILSATSMLQQLGILIMTTNGGPGNKTMNLPLLIFQTALRDNAFGLANAQGVSLIVLGVIAIGIINKIYRMNETV